MIPASERKRKQAVSISILWLLQMASAIGSAIDVADEIYLEWNLIDGRREVALVRKKMVEMQANAGTATGKETKLVPDLSTIGNMPVDMEPFSWIKALKTLGASQVFKRKY